ncbi:MAG TPA: oligosaccharide flippase family protein, partial [Spongiibacteraceae bacterium]|nr:oligosaccharide flippase family protein [Spongiibacteraceae bacterium]
MLSDRKLKKNILAMYFVQFANMVVPFMTTPYLARVLGFETFGQLAFAQAIAMYFVLLTDWGLALSAPAQIIQAQATPAKVQRIIQDVIGARLLLLALSFLLLIVVMLVVPNGRQLWALHFSAWLICVGNVMTLSWLLQARERLDLLAIATLVGKLLALPLIFFVVKAPADVWLAALLTSLSTIIAGIVSCIFARKEVPFRTFNCSLSAAVTQLKSSFDIFISNAAISLYTFSTTVILGIVSNSREVAMFSSADKVRGAVQSFIGPINQAMYPRAHQVA